MNGIPTIDHHFFTEQSVELFIADHQAGLR